ncbi:MAG: TonB family protein [Bacteroidales bacterium]|nr:TonB family protein [Bacteroidales bacterium]
MQRLSLIFIILILSLSIKCQIIYLDSNKSITDKESAVYYRDLSEKEGKLTDSYFYMNGQPHEIIELQSLVPYVKDGKYRLYYVSGELNYEIDYKDGAIDGYMIGYYKTGQILRKDLYKNNIFSIGNCYTNNGHDTSYFPHLVPPEFNYRGNTNFREFIQNNLKYPPIAAENGITGSVLVEFVVDTSGYITETRVKRTTNSIFNGSAVSAIRKSPRWKPAFRDGQKVKQSIVVPVYYYLK